MAQRIAAKRLIGAVSGFVKTHRIDDEVCVGLSGGADSLALTAAAVRAGLRVTALIVDHRLQDGSAAVAAAAAETARALGAQARVLPVTVTGGAGPEAAAREARYGALERARQGRPVLLGHTLDDQAETVLLGLGRGSGARSLSGMAPWRSPWGRPLLSVRRAQTRQACRDWELVPWDDPHNDDPRYTRVRLRREVLPLLDEVLGGGVPEALARTADQLRADADVLDGLAADLLTTAESDRGLHCEVLAAAPAALRTRAVKRWLQQNGGGEAGARTVQQVDALIADWRGQGPIAVGGDAQVRLVAVREAGMLLLDRVPRRP